MRVVKDKYLISWQIVIFSLLLLISCRQQVRYEWVEKNTGFKPAENIVYYGSAEKIDTSLILRTKNPLIVTDELLNQAAELFNRMCSHCHGELGNRNAPMIKQEKYPPPPRYSEKVPEMSDGRIFLTIYNGKNLMPSHAELTEQEIWTLVHYVRYLSKTQKKSKP